VSSKESEGDIRSRLGGTRREPPWSVGSGPGCHPASDFVLLVAQRITMLSAFLKSLPAIRRMDLPLVQFEVMDDDPTRAHFSPMRPELSDPSLSSDKPQPKKTGLRAGQEDSRDG
jgi:hypothetical protein